MTHLGLPARSRGTCCNNLNKADLLYNLSPAFIQVTDYLFYCITGSSGRGYFMNRKTPTSVCQWTEKTLTSSVNEDWQRHWHCVPVKRKTLTSWVNEEKTTETKLQSIRANFIHLNTGSRHKLLCVPLFRNTWWSHRKLMRTSRSKLRGNSIYQATVRHLNNS